MKQRLLRHMAEETEDIGLTVFLGLLVFLVFVVMPWVDWSARGGQILGVGFNLLFLSGCLIGGFNAFWRVVALVLALGSIATGWSTDAIPGSLSHRANLIFLLLFMSLVAVALLRRVLGPGRFSGRRIRGAIAVFILLGLVFGVAFALVEELQPGSLKGWSPEEQRREHMPTPIYFSFVTLTTLGFGDVVPTGSAARTLAILEAVIGQLYLAILIARLVSLELMERRNEGG